MARYTIIRFSKPDHLTNGLYVQIEQEDGSFQVTDLDGEVEQLLRDGHTLADIMRVGAKALRR